MTQPDGGANSADLDKAQGSTNDKLNTQDGDGNDVQKQIEELNAKYDTLLKESKGKDTKISALLNEKTQLEKEKQAKEIASKTAEEQLEYYRNQTAAFERKEAFRTSFKEVGLNPDEFISIIDEKEPAIQAGKFAALLKAKTEESAKAALEKFKADELAKIGGDPKTKNKVITQGKDADKNNFLRGIAD